jgi:hypothetical protein
VSALQQEVQLALAALGFAPKRLHGEVDDGGVFQYDFVADPLPAKTKVLLPVVIEVDGSPHFFVNDLKQPLGDTLFKRRLVRAQVKRKEGHWDIYIYVNMD